MYYSVIKFPDVANGPGVRVTLFVSGCRNHCKGCFQPETWDFRYGTVFDEKAMQDILDKVSLPYVQGLTLLGGDPFEEENQKGLLPVVKRVKEAYPEKDIWAYTGYLLTDLQSGGRKHTADTDELLSHIDVLVDGPFIEEQKNLSLRFCGSSNQRIINLNKTK